MSTQREWTTIREYDDILFDYYNGIARITINRERYRNAFTPTTTAEMSDALHLLYYAIINLYLIYPLSVFVYLFTFIIIDYQHIIIDDRPYPSGKKCLF